MRPELFRVLDIAFPAYFLLLLTGFLFATAAGAVWARRIGRDPDVIVDLGLACLLMGVVGGRYGVLASARGLASDQTVYLPSSKYVNASRSACRAQAIAGLNSVSADTAPTTLVNW